jgi:hypothetical protein
MGTGQGAETTGAAVTEDPSGDHASYRTPAGPEPNQPTGGHPIKAVVLGIIGLWLILWVVIPNPKDQPVDPTLGVTTRTPGMTGGTPNVPHVTSRTVAVLPEFNAGAVLVPPDTTDEQVTHLLQRFKQARMDDTLIQYIPATSKGDKLGPHAIADIYIFSEKEWATTEALHVLVGGRHILEPARTGHAPSFREVVPHVRGHSVINLHDAENRDRGSLGYADEDGITDLSTFNQLV